jgi:hypothetical protein
VIGFKKSKRFFFEKKKQKTFGRLGSRWMVILFDYSAPGGAIL